jgi:hypothetical protein
MSSILYYSNFCEHSKKLLATLSRTNVQKEIHFICIDKRVKDPNGKLFIVLENGQKIIMPENVSRVPALLLLNQGYNVLYGESILQHLKPRQEAEVRKATQNNMEPMAFSFGGGGGSFGDIVSDQYSFLDQNSEDLEAKGNGGMRQMHNYVDLNYVDNITSVDEAADNKKGANRIAESSTQDMMKRIQEERESDLRKVTGNRPPMSY